MNYKLDINNIPKHIALIMDGNGRWATKRGLPRTMGHKKGAERIYDVLDTCKELNIEVVTVFAFSTENWKRSKDEIGYIFKILEEMICDNMEILNENDIQIKVIGDLERFVGEYSSFQNKIIEVIEETKNNKGVILNIALNYGSHAEIINAVKQIAIKVKNSELEIKDINERLFEEHLMTKGLPPIDLMIRTSGEERLSNFLLWQLAYSELMFTNTYWPDFNSKELKRCIYEYQQRERKFGNVK